MLLNEGNINKPLFIGMPVFNGEAYIARALDSLIGQNYCDWSLLIADNGSYDGTEEIAREYALRDSRISYVRHSSNSGAISNFIYLINSAKSDYFMWAAADDEWPDNYLERCINILGKYPNVQLVGGNVVNIDPTGNTLRKYLGFSGFDHHSKYKRIFSYLLAPEINGKANIIYSIYRTSFCLELCNIPDILNGWGSDMAFVLAALERGRYKYIDTISIRKRVTSENDITTALQANFGDIKKLQFYGTFPPDCYDDYYKALLCATTGNITKMIVFIIMRSRFCLLMTKLNANEYLKKINVRVNNIKRRFGALHDGI